MTGGAFSRSYPLGDDPLPVRIAKITLQWNELREIDPRAAEDLAKAFLSGALTPAPKKEAAMPWQR
jgi:hypothetical protein